LSIYSRSGFLLPDTQEIAPRPTYRICKLSQRHRYTQKRAEKKSMASHCRRDPYHRLSNESVLWQPRSGDDVPGGRWQRSWADRPTQRLVSIRDDSVMDVRTSTLRLS